MNESTAANPKFGVGIDIVRYNQAYTKGVGAW